MVKQEKIYEEYLRVWLKDKGKLIPYKKQIRFNIKYYNDKSCQPDIIAHRKEADSVYIFEVKDTTGIKGIGQTFGQLLATKFVLEKMDVKKKEKLYKKLKKGNPYIKNPRIRFCVAFTKRTYDKSRIIVNKIRSKYFKDIGVIYILNKNKCKFEFRGKPSRFIKRKLKFLE